MNSWAHLPMAFGVGFTMGGIVAFLHYRTKIGFYKQYIDTRLASINNSLRRSSEPISNGQIRRAV